MSGDAVTAGFYYPDKPKNWFEKLWKKFQLPFILQKREYAFTLGNHDARANYNRSQVVWLD